MLFGRLARALPAHRVLAQVALSQMVGVKKGANYRAVETGTTGSLPTSWSANLTSRSWRSSSWMTATTTIRAGKMQIGGRRRFFKLRGFRFSE